MTRERIVRLMAGSFILLSLLLYHLHSHHWLWLTLFVGANLFQSALTRWCLSENILKNYFHVKSDAEIACKSQGTDSTG